MLTPAVDRGHLPVRHGRVRARARQSRRPGERGACASMPSSRQPLRRFRPWHRPPMVVRPLPTRGGGRQHRARRARVLRLCRQGPERERAGAVGVIIYNKAANVNAAPPGMADDGINGAFVTVPSVSVRRADGLALLAQVPAGVTASLAWTRPSGRAPTRPAGRACMRRSPSSVARPSRTTTRSPRAICSWSRRSTPTSRTS